MHRGEKHTLSRPEPAHVLASLDHFPRDVTSKNMRQLHARKTFAYPHIQMVQGTGSHPHQHLIFAWLGIGDIFVNQHFRTAKLMDANRFH